MLTALQLQILFASMLWGLIILLLVMISRSGGAIPGSVGRAPNKAAPSRSEPWQVLLDLPASADLPRRTERIVIGSSQVVIGRSAEAGLRIDDEFTSSRHAVIRQSSGKLEVEDLGSKNGTLVNGRRISGVCPLKEADVVEIGAASIRVL